MNPVLHLDLPDWLPDLLRQHQHCRDDEDKVRLAIELAHENVHRHSGGPFGAVIFDQDDRVVAAGVNRVVPMNCSTAHAEMMAFMFAQRQLGRFRLNSDGNRYTLATSAQPCAMCFGGSLWAGIDRLLIGARGSDVEELSDFDEGPLPEDWVGELRRRRIEVVADILRDQARGVFERYRDSAGVHY
ncbi:MAG: nucleoside deaminase [Xanthomonadales bacterium]|nr:nucleoside deaminase [Xanthomonadales bacterium]